jgi:hypothetical protein
VVRLKARTAPFVVFGVLWGGVFILAAITGITAPSARPVAALLLGVLAIFMIWLKSFLLELTGGTVRYKTLFSEVRMRVRDIASMRVETGISERYLDRFKVQGFVRLVIEPVSMLKMRPVVINASVLGYGGVMTFASEVEAQAGRRLLET